MDEQVAPGRDLSILEVAILRALADGLQSKEIALRVGRRPPTVEFYIRGMFGKLGARSRAQLVARAYIAGVLNG